MYQIDFKKPVHIYFMGIGGISMSTIAALALERGCTVTGSDRSRNANIETIFFISSSLEFYFLIMSRIL